MKVNGCGRSDALKESRLGWSAWKDVVQVLGVIKGTTKNTSKIYCTVALDGHQLTN
jgi:hypothetical protein